MHAEHSSKKLEKINIIKNTLTIGKLFCSSFAKGLGVLGVDFFNTGNKLCTGDSGLGEFSSLGNLGVGFFKIGNKLRTGLSDFARFEFCLGRIILREVFGVDSGDESKSFLSSASFSGESTCIFAKRFFKAAAIIAAGSPPTGDFALSRIGVPPGDLQ